MQLRSGRIIRSSKTRARDDSSDSEETSSDDESESESEAKRYLDRVEAMLKQGDSVDPRRGPLNCMWSKALDTKFSKRLFKLVKGERTTWGPYETRVQNADVPESQRDWTRLGFFPDFWKQQLALKPKFAAFVRDKACTPFAEVFNRGSDAEFSIINITFPDALQDEFLGAFAPPLDPRAEN